MIRSAAQRPVAATPPVTAESRPVGVITFNTAVGNSKIQTPQTAFTDLPFYQDIIQGRPNAAILAGQEIGPTQAAKLKELSKNGNFTVVHASPRPQQGNVLLVPKRFEVLEAKNHTFTASHAKGVFGSLKDWLTKGEKPNLGQLVEPRMYTEVTLKDSETGKTFTVFNTHLSTEDELRAEMAKELASAVNEAKKRGPVILAGDLNVRAANSNPSADDQAVLKLFAGLQDMGPATPPGKRPNIDYVLADGFDPVSSKYYLGDSLQLPGQPNAEVISDHYAEEDWFRFE